MLLKYPYYQSKSTVNVISTQIAMVFFTKQKEEDGMVLHACYSNTWELEAGGSAVQIQSWLHTEYEASLGYNKRGKGKKRQS